jgi:hypothetical protein
VSELALEQNYPNPWADETEIEFSIPEDHTVTINLYDEQMRFLFRSEDDYKKGRHKVRVRNAQLRGPGLYFYEMQYGNYSIVKKMVLIE